MSAIDLGHLDAFAAIAEHKSFRRAAAARGVSASTLSQTIRDLEQRLGLRLLNRTTRSVAPTEAGARLLERLGPALGDIRTAVDQALSEVGVPAGRLRINAPQPAIELVLAPLVAGFLAAYPRVRLEVIAETALIDIVEAGYDAGVRWGEHLAQDMIAVSLGPPQRYLLVSSPDLIARTGVPKTPRDLLDLPCIRLRYPSGVMPPWEFEQGGEVLRLDPGATLISSNVELLRRAAIDGVGFCPIFDGYVAEDIAAGRLVSVLDDWLPPFPGPFLYYPSNRQVPPALRAFVDFVRRERG